MSKIFISHSSVNNAQALAVAEWLEKNGWGDYFLDVEPSRGLVPGERWQEALKQAAHRCEAVLFLISPAWRDSRWCLAEFLQAKQLGKTIFGLLIESIPLDTIPPEMTGEWQLCDLVNGAERYALEVCRDPVVPRTSISFAKDGLARLKIGLRRAGLDPSSFPWPPPNDPERAPYRGLKPLQAEDAAVFFGREAAIVRGLDALRVLRDQGVEPMMVILGASGSGKSSFLRAGLWPRLVRDDLNFLPLPVIRPERAVLSGATGLTASLESAFRQRSVHKSRVEIRKTLRETDGLRRLLTDLRQRIHEPLASAAPSPTVVICIDQGEELWLSEGRAEAEEFLTLLAAALAPSAGDDRQGIEARRPALALLAIRSDSYGQLQKEPRFQSIAPQLFDLKPIAEAEFKSVVEGPAARATAANRKLIIAPALTERLLRDAKGADALPLLAFTLERLFVEGGGDGELTLSDYDTLGGVRGSIEAAVEAAFLDPERKPGVPSDKAEREKLLRKAFVPWLAGIDPQTEERKRRVALWDELPTETHPLLERLIEARLLLRDRRRLEDSGDETTVIEVAHEALLRQWPSLAVWLDQDAAALKAVETVRRAAVEWRKNDRGEAWLVHSGERLRTAEETAKRPDLHRLLGVAGAQYLLACAKRDDAARAEREDYLRRVARAQKGVWVLLAAIFVVLAAAGSRIIWQSRAVCRQTSLILTAAAEKANDEEHFDRALRYAVLAAQTSWLKPLVPEVEPQLARAAHSSRLVAALKGHHGTVNSAAFSADGKRVVTASHDKTARVWDAAGGKELAKFEGHAGAVNSAVFSADGKRLVTASADKTARVWDAAGGKELTKLEGHADAVNSAVFSGDGKRVVTAAEDGTARVWDADSGKELAKLEDYASAVNSAVFSGDGKRVVTAAEDGTARVWDADSGRELAKLEDYTSAVNSAAFSEDGKRVVTASRDKTARVWDAASGRELAKIEGHADVVNSAVLSADGKRLVTTSDDETARVWDANSGQKLARFEGHEDIVKSAVFSGDGKRLVTASYDGTARVWDAANGKDLAKLEGHAGVVSSAVFSGDGKRMVTASYDGTARVWDAASGNELARLEGHASPVNTAVFSADDQRVVTASLDRTARVWDAASGKELARLDGHAGAVNTVVFSGDGQRVVTASNDRTARVWDAASGRELAKLEGHAYAVNTAVFSGDGQRAVTASNDRTARVWDAAGGKELARLDGHAYAVNTAVFSGDGRRVLTASAGKSARVWDAASGKELAKLEGHAHAVNSAFWSADGQRAVTASNDRTARVWDVASGKELAKLEGHAGAVNSAVLSGDGRRAVTASMDNTARIWDVHWLTQLRGEALLRAVCREKLNGASQLTDDDVRNSPVLRGRSGEDVCAAYR